MKNLDNSSNIKNILDLSDIAISRLVHRYFPDIDINTLFAKGFPASLIKLLAEDIASVGISGDVSYIESLVYGRIQGIFNGTQVTASEESSLRGPRVFYQKMNDIYNGANLGPTETLKINGIDGPNLPRQYGKLLTYNLPIELVNIVEGASKELQLVFIEYKKNNPGIKLDFVPYTKENIHSTIIQTGFSDSDFLDSDITKFKEAYSGKKFNPIDIEYNGIGLGRDSLVIKYDIKTPLAHVSNQILAKYFIGDKSNTFFDRQGWGFPVVIGRFVGKNNDKYLIDKISSIVDRLKLELLGLNIKRIDSVTPKHFSHYFSDEGGSEFNL